MALRAQVIKFFVEASLSGASTKKLVLTQARSAIVLYIDFLKILLYKRGKAKSFRLYKQQFG
jgi:hypothetical protein